MKKYRIWQSVPGPWLLDEASGSGWNTIGKYDDEDAAIAGLMREVSPKHRYFDERGNEFIK